MDETCDMLRTVWRTRNLRTLPLSATGSAGIEAAFVNTVGEGDVVVVGVNGLFGQRMCEVASRCGAQVVPVEHEWGTAVDADRVLSAHPSPKIIAAVHAETSTGVRSDIAALGAGKGDALLLADAVTSIGGIELNADAWEVDIGYAGTEKRLRVAPGLAPTAMVASLHAGLARILDEGLENVGARHEEAGRLLQAGLEAMGLELFATEVARLPELTTVKVPDGVDSAAVRSTLLERHGIEIGGGAGAYASSVWRIGLMGHNARRNAALLVLAALQDVLGTAGRPA